jgi:hypothetical protein
MIGDLQVTEFHDIAYDSNSNVIIGGTQDTGTVQQMVPGEVTWSSVLIDDFDFRLNGDGGDVAIVRISDFSAERPTTLTIGS